jgi:hypothetical protein
MPWYYLILIIIWSFCNGALMMKFLSDADYENIKSIGDLFLIVMSHIFSPLSVIGFIIYFIYDEFWDEMIDTIKMYFRMRKEMKDEEKEIKEKEEEWRIERLGIKAK